MNRAMDLAPYIEDEWAIINEGIRAPIQPMVGCAGLAPISGASSTIYLIYRWGGNLDLRELGPGSTLYLPIQVEEALLSVGDLHAAMGTGEPTSMGLESAGEATVRITVDRGLSLRSPRILSEGSTILI